MWSNTGASSWSYCNRKHMEAQNQMEEKRMSVISMKQLLEAGVHFGHQTRRWNPKMAPYIYTERNGIYIIDLQKSVGKVDEAYNAVADIVANGGTILFVGTKKQAQDAIRAEAERCGMYYVNERWLGGMLTNFKTIQSRIAKLKSIEKMEEDGTFDVLPKKEVLALKRLQEKLEKNLGGIKEMKKLPDAMIVIDPREEHNAVAEAKKLGIPVFAMLDTNCDPEDATYPIASNDDANRSVRLVTSILADAIVDAKGGLLESAYLDDAEDDVTMDDVIRNVEAQIAENERRRRLRNEERRKRNMERRNRRPYDRNSRGPRPNGAPVRANAEAKPAETKTEA